MFLISRYWNSPTKGGAADTQILEAPLDEAHNLIHPGGGDDKVGVGVIEVQKLFLKSREFKEIALLGHELCRASTVGTICHTLGGVGFTVDAIVSTIFAQVDEIVLFDPFEHLRYGVTMSLFCGTDELIETEAQFLPDLPKRGRVGVGEFSRRQTLLAGSPFNFEPMFIRTGQRADLQTTHPLVTGNRISDDRRIGVPHMRNAVDVIERSSQIKSVTHSLDR